jgi:transcriptional regulator with XRE-family HTH domain
MPLKTPILSPMPVDPPLSNEELLKRQEPLVQEAMRRAAFRDRGFWDKVIPETWQEDKSFYDRGILETLSAAEIPGRFLRTLISGEPTTQTGNTGKDIVTDVITDPFLIGSLARYGGKWLAKGGTSLMGKLRGAPGGPPARRGTPPSRYDELEPGEYAYADDAFDATPDYDSEVAEAVRAVRELEEQKLLREPGKLPRKVRRSRYLEEQRDEIDSLTGKGFPISRDDIVNNLSAQGLSAKEIATKFGVQESTINNILRRSGAQIPTTHAPLTGLEAELTPDLAALRENFIKRTLMSERSIRIEGKLGNNRKLSTILETASTKLPRAKTPFWNTYDPEIQDEILYRADIMLRQRLAKPLRNVQLGEAEQMVRYERLVQQHGEEFAREIVEEARKLRLIDPKPGGADLSGGVTLSPEEVEAGFRALEQTPVSGGFRTSARRHFDYGGGDPLSNIGIRDVEGAEKAVRILPAEVETKLRKLADTDFPTFMEFVLRGDDDMARRLGFDEYIFSSPGPSTLGGGLADF